MVPALLELAQCSFTRAQSRFYHGHTTKAPCEGARPTGVAGVRRGQTLEETVRGLVAGQHRHRSPCAVCTSPILLFATERSRSNRRAGVHRGQSLGSREATKRR